LWDAIAYVAAAGGWFRHEQAISVVEPRRMIAGAAPPPALPITRKVRIGVVVAAIIAGMFVLMGIINDVENGLHDLNESSQK
jgi:hypothetical protein